MQLASAKVSEEFICWQTYLFFKLGRVNGKRLVDIGFGIAGVNLNELKSRVPTTMPLPFPNMDF